MRGCSSIYTHFSPSEKKTCVCFTQWSIVWLIHTHICWLFSSTLRHTVFNLFWKKSWLKNVIVSNVIYVHMICTFFQKNWSRIDFIIWYILDTHQFINLFQYHVLTIALTHIFSSIFSIFEREPHHKLSVKITLIRTEELREKTKKNQKHINLTSSSIVLNDVLALACKATLNKGWKTKWKITSCGE